MSLTWHKSSVYYAVAISDKGRYTVCFSRLLDFTPNDGITPDPFDQGSIYLGYYDDPFLAAENHAETGFTERGEDNELANMRRLMQL
jgi:hypothetical protein